MTVLSVHVHVHIQSTCTYTHTHTHTQGCNFIWQLAWLFTHDGLCDCRPCSTCHYSILSSGVVYALQFTVLWLLLW